MADPYPFRVRKQFPPSTSSRKPNSPITRAREGFRLSALFRNLFFAPHFVSYRLANNAPWTTALMECCLLGRGSYTTRMAYAMHTLYLDVQTLFRTRRPRSKAKRRRT